MEEAIAAVSLAMARIQDRLAQNPPAEVTAQLLDTFAELKASFNALLDGMAEQSAERIRLAANDLQRVLRSDGMSTSDLVANLRQSAAGLSGTAGAPRAPGANLSGRPHAGPPASRPVPQPAPATPFDGASLVAVAEAHVGEEYILGSRVRLDDPGFTGPWDCAEFVSWCVYQTYGQLVGVDPRGSVRGDAYTGYWWEDSASLGLRIPVAEALATAGTILLRRPTAKAPGEHAVGHIAISRGDGTTVEARGRRFGVVIAEKAAERPWDTGVRLSGPTYAASPVAAYAPSPDLLMVRSPFMRSATVVAVQRALAARGISPGTVDGVFGEGTESAVYNFQAREGVATDGVVGRETAGLLNLAWPIQPTADDNAAYEQAQRREGARLSGLSAARDPQPLTVDGMIDDILRSEGGFVNHLADRGGPTNFGITQDTLSGWLKRPATIDEVRALDVAVARQIFRANYFEQPGLDRLPAALQPIVFDMAVLHGPSGGVKIMQQALNALGATCPTNGRVQAQTVSAAESALAQQGRPACINAMVDERIRYVEAIVANNPSQGVFLQGWRNRANRFRIPT